MLKLLEKRVDLRVETKYEVFKIVEFYQQPAGIQNKTQSKPKQIFKYPISPQNSISQLKKKLHFLSNFSAEKHNKIKEFRKKLAKKKNSKEIRSS